MAEQIGLEAILQDKNFTSGLAKMAAAVTGYDAAAQKSTNNVMAAFTRMGTGVLGVVGKVAKGLAVGVGIAGTAAAAGIGLAVKESISLESAFAGVIKTTDGLTDSAGNLTELGAQMRQEFRDLAKEAPIAVEELMQIGELGGQLGIASEGLTDFTKTIAAMGVATNLSTEEAAVGFAQMANIMGTSSDQIENMGSAVVALGNNMATTERDIFNFANRIAGAGAVVGLSEAEVFGIGAAFSSVGVKAEAGGTAVQKVLLSMNDAAVSGGKALQTFAEVSGFSAEDFQEHWGPHHAGEIFTMFVQGLGEAGDDAVGILKELGLEDQRLISAFLSLSGAGDLLNDSLNLAGEAFQENTALANEAATRYETTESKIQIFKNSIRDLGFTIGDAVIPYFNQLLTAITPWLEQLGTTLPVIIEGTIIPAITNLITVIGTIRDAFQPLITGIGFLMEGDFAGFFEGLVFTIQELGAALGFSDEAINNFVMGISAIYDWLAEKLPLAIAFVTAHMDEFKGALVGIGVVLAGAGIIAAIAGIVAALNPITLVIGAIIAAAALLGAAWAGNWGGIQDKTQAVIGFIQPKIEAFVSAIQTIWATYGDDIIATVSGIWESIKSAFEWYIGFLSELVKSFQAAFEGDWSAFGEHLRAAWDMVWDMIKTTVTNGIQALKAVDWGAVGAGIIDGIVAGIEASANIIGERLKAIAQAALEAAMGFLGIESPSTLFKEMVGEPIVEGIVKGIDDSEDDLTKSIRGVLERTIKVAEKTVDEGQSKLGEKLKWLYGGNIYGLLGTAESTGQFASGFAGMFKQQTIDPMKKGVSELDKAIDEQNKLIKAKFTQYFGELSDYEQMQLRTRYQLYPETMSEDERRRMSFILALEAERGQMIDDRSAKMKELAEQEERMIELQKQQQDLAFLQQQLELVDWIKSQGFAPAEILQGMELGLDASLPDLIDAMSRAMAMVIDAANDEFGIASPSKVAVGWGENIMGSFGDAISSMASLPAMEMADSMSRAATVAGAVSSAPLTSMNVSRTANVSFGDTNISSGMDEALLENLVRRVLRSELGVAS